MSSQKLYAGVALRDVRLASRLTQKDFAARLGVSLSYLNQMENNTRPTSAAAVLGLAREFGFDVSTLAVDEADRMVADMREALVDPVFGSAGPTLAELQLVATNAPGLSRAFLTLYRAHRQRVEQIASLSDVLGDEGTGLAPQPWEEVRDFFHYCDNYIDAVDRAGERFAEGLEGAPVAALAAELEQRHGIAVRIEPGGATRSYDAQRATLRLSAESGAATQAFQIAHQVALIAQAELIEATLDLADFRTETARNICRIGLANYFAGAVLLPYGRFRAAAEEKRHDLEQLALAFGASLEQVAHRLSTLQRAGNKGVPFFFVRVDPAGTITKRHSATRLQFARFGGACPLWNVHRAFETPGQWLRQAAETPDGVRYFCLARDISRSGGSFAAPTRRYAIGLGCEVQHAGALVYADGMDLSREAEFDPIGISCRMCERPNCHQRALPPMDRALRVDPAERGILPYSLQ
ncbi:helix-turn-helix domain-containing protein [Algicella marina]|uniref:ImmA/IrrE family metallo-endopeptidase n=1 Tax=Algicella marina TaxID=2683284 RepID=A0A6P1SWU8_9RHOB|nr:helix-turn-helix transcriptional regulator [Algicella marina]QHQ33995.1 ImmA/IrrE family metallo-endopeptidase [Algicella marina]